MLFRQMLQRFWKKDPRVLFDDTFDGSAISINFWTLTDTESKMTVTGSNLSFSGGLAAPGWADPALVSKQSWARIAGLTVEWEVTPGATNTAAGSGFSNSTLHASGRDLHSIQIQTDGLLYVGVGPSVATLKTPATYAAVSTWLRIVLLSAGALYYVSTDNQATWEAIWKDVAVTTTPVYAFSESYDAALTASRCVVRLGSVKPATLSASPAAPTLTLDAELATGNLTVGSWYKITATQVDYFYAGCAINDFFRATAATALDANNKVQKLPTSTTGSLTYIGDAGQHDNIYDAAPTVALVNHAGIVAHANSATAPSYYLHAYVDRTAAKAYLLKVENNTTTELIGVAITYSAGAQLRVVSVGTKHALYYNGAIVGTVQTIDVSSNYGTHVHSFQTAAGDSVGVCAVNGGT